MTSKTFPNPYDGIPGDKVRLNSKIPLDKFNRIKRCRLQTGTVQTTISTLWEKLINLLDQHGISDCTDSVAYENLIKGCRIVYDLNPTFCTGVANGPVDVINTTTNLPDVRTGTPLLGGATPDRTLGHSDISVQAPTGVGRARDTTRPAKRKKKEGVKEQ